jgi:glutathione S-transferase
MITLHHLENSRSQRNLDFIEATLTKSPWFCGKNMTAADVQMSFPLEAAAVRTDLQEHYPKAAAYLKRIHALPAYKVALKKGGPYALMGGK